MDNLVKVALAISMAINGIANSVNGNFELAAIEFTIVSLIIPRIGED